MVKFFSQRNIINRFDSVISHLFYKKYKINLILKNYLILINVIFFNLFINTAFAENDPTQPINYHKNSIINKEPLVLSSILNKANLTFAVINQKRVKRGDKIFDYKVISINQRSVVLEKNGKFKQIMIQNSVLNPVAE